MTIDSDKLDKLTKEQRESGVLFVGNSNSFENNVVSVLALVENFRGFARHEANVTKPYLEIKGEQHYDFSDVHALRASIRKAFARSYLIEEESWLRIHDRSTFDVTQGTPASCSSTARTTSQSCK